jgi:amidase
MNPAEYRSFDALALAEHVRRGEVTPHELLDVALAAIEASNGALNAVIATYEAQARAAIDAGLPPGPFQGVPFALKDLSTDVAGLPSGNGSALFRDAFAEHDCELVSRYRRAGFVIAAKTNTPELGLSATTEPSVNGATHNPWRRGTSPGGSSGGAAAAVAAGYFPMAHATDGGGSVRIPAAHCGLFGLKPTRARISLGPDRGEGWNGMSSVHVVSRSVRDSAAALDASAGYLPGDPYLAPPAAASYLQESATDPGPLRVGVALAAPTGVAVAHGMSAAAQHTAGRCAALGHGVEEVQWPASVAQLAAASGTITSVHTAAAVQARLEVLGRDLRVDDLEPVTAALVDAGRAVTAVQYVRAVQAMHAIGRSVALLFDRIDVLVTPTVARPAPPHGVLAGTDMQRFAREVGPFTAFTSLANVTGQPAMSLPLDVSDDGMPIGSHVIGRFGDEATLLRLAGQLERAHPWFDRIPAAF